MFLAKKNVVLFQQFAKEKLVILKGYSARVIKATE